MARPSPAPGPWVCRVCRGVAAAGNSCRVHAARPARRQRGTRTVSWLLSTGSRRRRPRRPRPGAGPLGSLAGAIQHRSPPRSAGTAHPRLALSAEPPHLSRYLAATALSVVRGAAARAQPGTHQMAGTLAVCGPRLGGAIPRTQIPQRRILGSVSGPPTHWPTSLRRSRRDASGPLATPSKLEAVNCHPCPVTPVSPMSCHRAGRVRSPDLDWWGAHAAGAWGSPARRSLRAPGQSVRRATGHD